MSTCWPYWACYTIFNQYEVEWFMQTEKLLGRKGGRGATMTMKTKLKVPREKECQWKQEIKEVTGSNGFF
ncbi:hypothetical protein M6B38_130425 [Iris pallida]|uniref:Uncharacterized protein n=1 Tax=Iris pallida TaxID=29817 RepID=A0AAX6FZX5_IRIPA|nr:hypothetical protein M6B38_130425 [Iris pallida]